MDIDEGNRDVSGAHKNIQCTRANIERPHEERSRANEKITQLESKII